MTEHAVTDAPSNTTDLFEIIRTTRSMRRLKSPVEGESTANSSLKLGADSGRVMDDFGIVKRCFALEFRRKLSSLPWQQAPHSDN